VKGGAGARAQVFRPHVHCVFHNALFGPSGPDGIIREGDIQEGPALCSLQLVAGRLTLGHLWPSDLLWGLERRRVGERAAYFRGFRFLGVRVTEIPGAQHHPASSLTGSERPASSDRGLLC